jgi:predicted RNA-binding Zn ribbon-like protein
MTSQPFDQVTTGNVVVMTMPSWVQAEETKPAPMPLLLVQAFVNTWVGDDNSDLLRDPETAQRWFVEAGLLQSGDPLGAEDLRTAQRVRESIRGLLAANADATPPAAEDLAPLRDLAASRRARVCIDRSGEVRVEAEPGGELEGALLGLLLVIRDAQSDGSWKRMKACENDECRWAFYDRSHSRRGRWCDMAVCGNRMKNRSLRTRQRSTRPAAGSADRES